MCSPAHPKWRLCTCSATPATSASAHRAAVRGTRLTQLYGGISHGDKMAGKLEPRGERFQWKLKRIQGTNLLGHSPSFGSCAPVLWRGVSSVHDIWPSSFSFSISQPISLSYALLSSVTHSWSEQSPQTRRGKAAWLCRRQGAWGLSTLWRPVAGVREPGSGASSRG